MGKEGEIPKHWEVVVSSSILDIRDGTHNTPSYVSNDGVPLITSKNLKEDQIDFKNVKLISHKDHEEISKRSKVEIGDVLFAMIGTIGNPAIIRNHENFSIKNVGLFKKNESVIVPGFLFNFLRSNVFIKQLNDRKLLKGTTQKFIPLGGLRKIHIPLPPLPEQQAIVAKIEELLSDLDNGKRQLLTAQQQLKVYRQSLLKAAFEGKLTEAWRRSQVGVPSGSQVETTPKMHGSRVRIPAKSQEVPKVGIEPKEDSLVPRAGIEPGELPEGWRWGILEEYAALITKGASPRWQGYQYIKDENQLLFVTSENVRENYIDISNPKYLDLKFNDIQKRSQLIKGDVLFNLVGASIGRAAVFNTDKIANVNQAVAVIRVKESLKNSYLSFFLNSEVAKQEYLLDIVDVARANLSLEDARKMRIPVPSLAEQAEVVLELESKLTVCDKLEEAITTGLQQAETLKQSILKQAFEGRLVSVTEVKTKEAKVVPYPIEEFPRKVEGISAVDLHAGIIAMVVDLHEKNTRHKDKLNHVKCEKISDLVERKLGISLGRVAVKDAAGPDDYPHLKKVEHRANKANFFKTSALKPIGHTYKPLRSMDAAIEKVKAALTEGELKEIEALLQTFLPFDMERAEVVATVYAGWNNLLLQGKQPTDEEIVYESRENWSKRKLTIERENFFKTIKWMREHGYVPEGKGQTVKKRVDMKEE